MNRIQTRTARNAMLGLSAVVALAGCATQPLGPSVVVMPAANKPFEVFQQDQAVCTQYASQQVGGAAQEANSKAVGTAVVGTLLGAGLGAAVGGGQGAAVGAASGAVVGTAIGANGAAYSQYSLQQRYDIAYSQCMYAKGNQLPGYYYGPTYAAPAPPPPPPPPPMAAQPQDFSVYFDFDRSNLTSEGAKVVDQAIAQAQRMQPAQIQVGGYTDAAGADSYNLNLAQNRADTVRDYMIGHGVPADRILVRTFGKSDPRVATAEGVPEARNRRVEILISPPANLSYGQPPLQGNGYSQP
jgi:outer membrane protein OmpA-like peptidoglycan-associated protein